MGRWLGGCFALALLVPGPGSAQAEFGWRASGGIGYGMVASTGPHQEDGQTPVVYRFGVERSVGRRFGLGLEWTGSWYAGRFGTERRQAVTALASIYPVQRLNVRGGLGAGVASWVTMDGPPAEGAGDVDIGVSDGDASLALVAGLAYDLPLGVFQLSPEATWMGHRLHDATVSMVAVGARVSLGTRP